MGPPVIVIVEDDLLLLTWVSEVFTEEGYLPVLARGGADALALIRETRLALVILDLVLDTPETCGEACLRALRAQPDLARLPVIVWSADHARLRAQAAELAALGVGVVPKPFDLEQLLQTVQAALAGSRLSA